MFLKFIYRSHILYQLSNFTNEVSSFSNDVLLRSIFNLDNEEIIRRLHGQQTKANVPSLF